MWVYFFFTSQVLSFFFFFVFFKLHQTYNPFPYLFCPSFLCRLLISHPSAPSTASPFPLFISLSFLLFLIRLSIFFFNNSIASPLPSLCFFSPHLGTFFSLALCLSLLVLLLNLHPFCFLSLCISLVFLLSKTSLLLFLMTPYSFSTYLFFLFFTPRHTWITWIFLFFLLIFFSVFSTNLFFFYLPATNGSSCIPIHFCTFLFSSTSLSSIPHPRDNYSYFSSSFNLLL